MKPTRIERVSILEAFLPLLFFGPEKIFVAALLIFLIAGITLSIFEVLRSQSRYGLSAFYLFWLAACGGLGWMLAGIPPYWVWSVHLLIPENAWAPSDIQRMRPFLYGFKKYGRRRFKELTLALLYAGLFAGMVLLLRQNFEGPLSWILTALALILFEVLHDRIQRQKK